MIDNLKWRYATKRMNGQKVSSEKVEKILEAIQLAPTSLGLQPFTVLIVTDPEMRAKIAPAITISHRLPKVRRCWFLLRGLISVVKISKSISIVLLLCVVFL